MKADEVIFEYNSIEETVVIWISRREDGLSNIVVSHILNPVWEGSGNNLGRDSSDEGSNNNGGEIS